MLASSFAAFSCGTQNNDNVATTDTGTNSDSTNIGSTPLKFYIIIRNSATMSFARFYGQLVGNPLQAISFTTGETYASAPNKLTSSCAFSVKKTEKNPKKVIEKYSAIE